MESSQNLPTVKVYSLKRFFFFWLPLALGFSVLLSLLAIFIYKDYSYIHVANPFQGLIFFERLFLVFLKCAQFANGMLMGVVIISSFLFFFIFPEVFLLKRAVQIYRSGQSSKKKLVLRIVGVQFTSIVLICACFYLIFFSTFAVVFTYGYFDLKSHERSAMEGVFSTSDNTKEVISSIQNATTSVDVYDSSNELGIVLAQKALKKKSILTGYEGLILPAVVILGKPIQPSFYMKSSNSFVYTSFDKNSTPDILIQLAYNHLRYHDRPLVQDIFNKKEKPVISYLEDNEYTPFLTQKEKELNAKAITDLQQVIDANKKIVADCVSIVAKNNQLDVEQGADYQKRCVDNVEYNNCPDLKELIANNKVITQNSIKVCEDNKKMLNSQYKDMDVLKKNISDVESSTLEKNKNEMSNGMYLSTTNNIYVRINPRNQTFENLVVLLHEMFHYYSGGAPEIPTFLNEGMTDYLTFKSFGLTDLEIADSAGYFKEAQILMALFEKIPEEDLLRAYFNNDQKTIKELFNKGFPEIDYVKFLAKADAVFKSTYAIENTDIKTTIWSTNIDHPAVQDIRLFLGLPQKKFFTGK